MPAARNSGRDTRGPQPGDMTAIQKQALEAEAAEERAARAAELAMSSAAEQEQRDHGIIDYFENAGVPLPEEPKKDVPKEPFRVVRMKFGVEQMAFGREIIREPEFDDNGNMTVPAQLGGIRYFDLEEGRQYRLPREMADHLDSKGYVYH